MNARARARAPFFTQPVCHAVHLRDKYVQNARFDSGPEMRKEGRGGVTEGTHANFPCPRRRAFRRPGGEARASSHGFRVQGGRAGGFSSSSSSNAGAQGVRAPPRTFRRAEKEEAGRRALPPPRSRTPLPGPGEDPAFGSALPPRPFPYCVSLYTPISLERVRERRARGGGQSEGRGRECTETTPAS